MRGARISGDLRRLQVVVKWLFPEEHSNRALALLADRLRHAERILAPPLLPVEVTNVIRQRMRTESLSASDALELLDQFVQFPITLTSPHGLHSLALHLSIAYGLPAVYDAHYVAVAEHAGCDLRTDDRRLLRILAGRLAFVRSIAEYPGTES